MAHSEPASCGELKLTLNESQSDMFIKLDRRNRLTFANHAFHRLLGKQEYELRNGTFVSCVHPSDREFVLDMIKRAHTPQHQIARFDCRVRSADRWPWIRWEFCLIRDQHGKAAGIQGVGRILDSHKFSRDYAYQASFHNLFADISSDFITVSCENVDEKINSVLRRMGEFFDVDRSYMLVFSSDRKTVKNTHEWCAPGVEACMDYINSLPSGSLPWWTEKTRKKELVHVYNVDNLPREASKEQKHFSFQHIQSLLTIPIATNDDVIGAFGFDSVRKKRKWNYNDIALLKVLANILAGAQQRLWDELERAQLRKEIKDDYCFEDIISRSRDMRYLFSIMSDIAESDSSVLIEGESGTGKEMVAKALHNRSLRSNGPFVNVNCGALPPSLLESELFGYKAGAFTDAKRDKPGRLCRAHKGTLFLDEIAELPVNLQVKLLTVLQDGTYEPVGSTSVTNANIRLICASNKDLHQLVESGDFREDLYYRINVMKLKLPALRDREGDIPILVEHFIEKYNRLKGKAIKEISSGVMAALMNYHYPGNVRELENIIEHCFVLCNGHTIETRHLPPSVRLESDLGAVGKTLSDGPGTLSQMEHLMISKTLRLTGGNKTAAARRLGIDPSTLFRKLKDMKIDGQL